MLQALRRERFKLKIHRETREVPVYQLTVAKGGHKLTGARAGSCVPLDLDHPDLDHPKPPPQPGQPQPRLCGPFLGPSPTGMVTYHQTMEGLCQLLSGILDRDVIDKTAIAGLFDINFEIDVHALVADLSPEAADGGTGSVEDGTVLVGAFRAALSKLGLKLEPAKGSGKFLVIDQVERPSEN